MKGKTEAGISWLVEESQPRISTAKVFQRMSGFLGNF